MPLKTPTIDAVQYIANVAAPSPVKRDYSDVMNRLLTANNLLNTRLNMMSQLLDPRRKIADDCGYPDPGQCNPSYYQSLYDWDPIAARAVEIYPMEVWQVDPSVYESEAMKVRTPFEKRWLEVCRGLRGELSYYEEEEGSPIWEAILEARVKAGVGRYGILLIGIDDNMDLSDPADMSGKQKRNLIYLRSFPETMCRVAEYEQNKSSPRYCQPVSYDLTMADPTSALGTGTPVRVHWSRVLHLSDTGTFAYPRLQQVLHRILDLQKLYAGSAEMYWRGAFPGLSFEVLPEFAGSELDQTAMKDMIESYMNSLQRYVALFGMTAKSLAPQVVSPGPQIDKHIDAICIRLAVPKRIFIGSERGELASTQDDDAWNDRLKLVQSRLETPRTIVPFVNRLIAMGVLPAPKRFKVWWPDLTSASLMQRAQIAQMRTVAIAQYVQTNIESIMTPLDFLTRELGYSQNDAQTVLKAAMHQNENPSAIADEPSGKFPQGSDDDTEPEIVDGDDDQTSADPPVKIGSSSIARSMRDKTRIRQPNGQYSFE